MDRVRKNWYEREEIKRITLDSISNKCKLTEREQELLPIINYRKLVRRDLLEIISKSYRDLGVNRTQILNRSINKLFKNSILDKVHEKQEIGKGNAPAILALDRGGSTILRLPHKQRIIQTKGSHNGSVYITRRLPINYQHIHGVNKLEVDTILFCETNDFIIVEWILEDTKSFIYNQERIILIPDITIVLNINEKPICIYIEYDTGSEGSREKEPRVIIEKILKYKQYRNSNMWIGEYWQQEFSNPTFPLLLFVTEDANRIDFFNRKSKEIGIRSVGLHSEKYIDILYKLSTLVQ